MNCNLEAQTDGSDNTDDRQDSFGTMRSSSTQYKFVAEKLVLACIKHQRES